MFLSITYDNVDNILNVVSDITDKLITDDVKLDVVNLFTEMCDPYVPYRTGRLANSAIPSVNNVTYTVDYADEQYERMDTNFTREFHPLATGHWDEVMLQNQGDEFYEKVKEIILQKAQEEGFVWR